MALLYGVVKTGFTEVTLCFRGLIAGSLGRRLPLLWANLLQSVIFLLPHLLILRAAPELAALLVPIFASATTLGVGANSLRVDTRTLARACSGQRRNMPERGGALGGLTDTGFDLRGKKTR